MERREFLTTATASLAILNAGCLDYINSNENQTDDSLDFRYGIQNFPEETVDEPPHIIEIPSENDWNSDYLGENMSTNSEIEFDIESDYYMSQTKLNTSQMGEPNEFVTYIIDTQEKYEKLFNPFFWDMNLDFSKELLLIIETGYHSSSIEHRWKSLYEIDTGFYMHGYFTKPDNEQMNYSTEKSVIRIQKPIGYRNKPKFYISLTVDKENRVNFHTNQDIVKISNF